MSHIFESLPGIAGDRDVILSDSSAAHEVTFVVCNAERAKQHDDAIPLDEVFDSAEWRDALDQPCNRKLFLISSTFSSFNELPNAKILSYKWGKMINIVCGTKFPGQKTGEYSSPKTHEIPSNIFTFLKEFNEDYIWIDFLSHLNDSSHKLHTMNKMGSLYYCSIVFPLYLWEYQSAEIIISALRRGWIQQEISYGALDPAPVKHFIMNSIKRQDFGSLATFIRRRYKALKWLYAKTGINANDCDRVDLLESRSMNKEKWELNRKLQPLTFHSSPPGPKLQLSGTYIAVKKLVTLAIAPLQPQEPKSCEEDGNDTKKQAEKSSVDIGKILSDKELATEVDTILVPLVSELTELTSLAQGFDVKDPFGAFQLLRSFAQSEILCESDAYHAMLPCPATASGLIWGDLSSTTANSAILMKCWETMIKSGQSFDITIEREIPEMQTLGLMRIYREIVKPFVVDSVNEKVEVRILIESESPSEDGLSIIRRSVVVLELNGPSRTVYGGPVADEDFEFFQSSKRGTSHIYKVSSILELV